jgi:hypothetical protein
MRRIVLIILGIKLEGAFAPAVYCDGSRLCNGVDLCSNLCESGDTITACSSKNCADCLTIPSNGPLTVSKPKDSMITYSQEL